MKYYFSFKEIEINDKLSFQELFLENINFKVQSQITNLEISSQLYLFVASSFYHYIQTLNQIFTKKREENEFKILKSLICLENYHDIYVYITLKTRNITLQFFFYESFNVDIDFHTIHCYCWWRCGVSLICCLVDVCSKTSSHSNHGNLPAPS